MLRPYTLMEEGQDLEVGVLSNCPLKPRKRVWRHRCRMDGGRSGIQLSGTAQLCSHCRCRRSTVRWCTPAL